MPQNERQHVEGSKGNILFAHLMRGVTMEVSAEQVLKGRLKPIPNGTFEHHDHIYEISATTPITLDQAQEIISRGVILPGSMNFGPGEHRDQYFSLGGVTVRERFTPR